MKTLIASAAIVVATATGAFAQSSALDVAPIYPEVNNVAAIDYAPTAAIGTGVVTETRANLGDGSPQYHNSAVVRGGIDFGATASIGNADSGLTRDRLGDGSPQYF
jgi:hypothetical protein